MRYVRKMKRVVSDGTVRRFVGIDPSLNGSALAVVDGFGRLITAKAWTTKVNLAKAHEGTLFLYRPPKGMMQDDRVRIHRIGMQAKWATDHVAKFWATSEVYVAIEGYAISRQSVRATDLHELGGLIKSRLWDLRVPYRIYTPSSLKLGWTGSGKAEKSDMALAALARLGVNLDRYGAATNDLIDAVLLAHTMRAEVLTRLGFMRNAPAFVDAMLRSGKRPPLDSPLVVNDGGFMIPESSPW